MKKTILITLYLITFTYCEDKCTYTDEAQCIADTANKCKWTATKAGTCADGAACSTASFQTQPTCTLGKCKWDANASGGPACVDNTACGSLTLQADCNKDYCAWSGSACAAVDCTKVTASAAECTAAKGCAYTQGTGTCSVDTSGGSSGGSSGGTSGDNNSQNNSFGLKVTFMIMFISLLF